MKKRLSLIAGSLLGIVAASTVTSEAVSFDFASVPGAKIQFDGAGGLEFLGNPGSGADFRITSGTASGLLGDIAGTFSVGVVTTVSGISIAPISGAGTFSIFDGVHTLTAAITWDQMFQFGTGNVLNVNGIVNMAAITYAGSNPDLLALKNDGQAINVVTFQFVPSKSLAFLKANKINTSFSGTITSVNVPDGGMTALLLGLGVIGFGFMPRARMQ